VAILQDVLPDDLAGDLYDSAVRESVWGEYVGLDELDELLLRDSNNNDQSSSSRDHHKVLAAKAVHSFFRETAFHLIQDDWNSNNIHGVSVWIIASGVGDSVQYHLDYAELFRFQTNCIYPPMYGGTLHLTNTTNMEGGGFYAHKDGLEHYQKHGYKCPLDQLGWDGTNISNDNDDNDNDENDRWVRVPYKYNQATLCDGDLAHFSAPVRHLPNNLQRVIVGFNVCNTEIGPIVQEYPEHSAKFNKYVKLSQVATKNTQRLNGGGLTVEACKKDPKLAAFVKLLARKMKEHEQHKQQQREQEEAAATTTTKTTKIPEPSKPIYETEQSKENNGVAPNLCR